jgi:hypothetical protein
MLCDATQEEGCAGDFHDVAFVLVGMTCVAHLRKRPAGQAAEASPDAELPGQQQPVVDVLEPQARGENDIT